MKVNWNIPATLPFLKITSYHFDFTKDQDCLSHPPHLQNGSNLYEKNFWSFSSTKNNLMSACLNIKFCPPILKAWNRMSGTFVYDRLLCRHPKHFIHYLQPNQTMCKLFWRSSYAQIFLKLMVMLVCFILFWLTKCFSGFLYFWRD